MKDQDQTITSETIEALMGRQSIRRFSDKPVTEAHIEAILGAAFRAPTSSNLQAYSVIIVENRKTREIIAEVAGNQQHVIDCPVFLAFCADLTRIEKAFQMNGHSLDDNNLEMGLVSTVDAALVGMSAYVAAESLGIQGVMIGAARNDPERVADALGLPNRAYVVFGMCLGFPEEAPKQKPRMAYTGMVHRERYDPELALSVVEPYDKALKAHYDSVGKPTTEDSWSYEVARKISNRPRQELREQLKRRGFDFT